MVSKRKQGNQQYKKHLRKKSKLKLPSMKTAWFLLVVFLVLGFWGLPTLSTRHYDENERVDYFPIVTAYASGLNGQTIIYKPRMSNMSELKPDTILWKEKADFEMGNDMHFYFKPMSKRFHYEVRIVSPVATQHFHYRIVENRMQPILFRTSGLIMWLSALMWMVVLVVLIIVGQFLIGIYRSGRLTPEMKRYQKHGNDDDDDE